MRAVTFPGKTWLPQLLAQACALALIALPAWAESTTQPNVVIILADDLGWRDVGYNGSEIETPRIDALAAEGVHLERFYAHPTCSPTRAALMTGRSPTRLGVVRPISTAMSTTSFALHLRSLIQNNDRQPIAVT